MPFIVYGAGAIGGVIGARLHQHGHEVALIARGAHLAAIRAGGLRVDAAGPAEVVAIPAVGHPSEIVWREGDVGKVRGRSSKRPNGRRPSRVWTFGRTSPLLRC